MNDLFYQKLSKQLIKIIFLKYLKKLRYNLNIKDEILEKKHCFKVKKELQFQIKVNQMRARIFICALQHLSETQIDFILQIFSKKKTKA